MAESARPRALSDASTFLDDLALQACDEADNLNEVMRAYIALEELVDTSGLNDSEVLDTNRTERSALLRLLNEALMSRIGTINAKAGAVRDALQRPSGM